MIIDLSTSKGITSSGMSSTCGSDIKTTTATTHIPVQASWKLSAKGSCNQITSETCCFYPQRISINQSTTFSASLPPQIASQSTLLLSDPRKYPVSIAGPRSPEDI